MSKIKRAQWLTSEGCAHAAPTVMHCWATTKESLFLEQEWFGFCKWSLCYPGDYCLFSPKNQYQFFHVSKMSGTDKPKYSFMIISSICHLQVYTNQKKKYWSGQLHNENPFPQFWLRQSQQFMQNGILKGFRVIPGNAMRGCRGERMSKWGLGKAGGRTDIGVDQGDFWDRRRLWGHHGHVQELLLCAFHCPPSLSYFTLRVCATSLVSSDNSFVQIIGYAGECLLSCSPTVLAHSSVVRNSNAHPCSTECWKTACWIQQSAWTS